MNKSAEWSAFKLALPELFAHRKRLIALSATSLLCTVAEISSIALMIPLLGGRFPIEAAAEYLSRFDRIDRAMITGALMVLLLCVRSALGWMNCRWSVQLESEVTRVASIRAMKSYSRLPLDFIHDAGQARLLDIAAGAPDSLGQMVQGIGGLATSFLSLCFIVAAMAVVSGPIVLVVLLTGFVSMYVVFLVTRRIEPLAHKVLEIEELQYETSLAYIENQRLLRVSKAELVGLRRLADIAMAIARLNIRYESISSLIHPINVLFGALLITAGLVYAALNPVELPLVLFFLVMASRLQPRFNELDSTRHDIVTLYPDVKRLFWLQGHALDDTSSSFLNESDYEDIRTSEDLTTVAKIDPVAAVLEELGGAEMHSRVSGLSDYLAVDEPDAIRLGREIVRSSLEVTRIVLNPKLPIRPTVVEFDSQCEHPVDRVILGNSITLTPGTLTLSLDEQRFTVHALTEEGARDIESGEMDRRVSELRSR